MSIDTPERDEWGYFQAKKALKKLLSGRKVRLEFEVPGKLERGGYGRILAYIWVDDVNVNVEMVRLGWSRFWIKYGKGICGGIQRGRARGKGNKKGIVEIKEGKINNSVMKKRSRKVPLS